ncbi:precorrin-2 C(20)-methyltransferase [Serpentinicella alkaliphila]|uniref:Precorrin-2/cobalt-factor-2 C20-methyltransferase n=1 Tax=Serpentinicella alkaliphila TaxID=1734049 RepID=A0A4R2TNE4_9FIRM|nr:precorrin-2 C(20)-methyltransferase [Serpentinicella alkaliphila]QUH27108.1 precorrin-2 C(20)-methyltransferase [Serpentinicella alkaliphila]TCQ05238.1 precorrin-2/cobalt-factor-2 C20-methyltransferase [Serpentinicella alkaliphila]
MSKFYGIGVGPGDKELLTLKAVRVLENIDLLIIPEAKKSNGSIAYEIAKDFINPRAEIIYMEFPMVNNTEIMYEVGKKAARVVESYAADGKDIGFITLGDPSVYSTYSYILKNLDSEVEVETIPGITSFCASAALLNKPLVTGEEILSIIPATADEELINRAIDVSGGQAFLKVFNHSEKLINILNEKGLIDNSVMVKRCGLEGCEVVHSIEEHLKKGKQYLSIVISRKEY